MMFGVKGSLPTEKFQRSEERDQLFEKLQKRLLEAAQRRKLRIVEDTAKVMWFCDVVFDKDTLKVQVPSAMWMLLAVIAKPEDEIEITV